MDRCRECQHEHRQHDGDGHCRVTVTRWDAVNREWECKAKCACPGYVGLKPVALASTCPHEFLDGSRVCCHCLRAVARR